MPATSDKAMYSTLNRALPQKRRSSATNCNQDAVSRTDLADLPPR